MSLRTLPAHVNLHGKRVLVCVDWNVPLVSHLAPAESLKIERTVPFLKHLVSRGAIVILLTHLGRPKKPSAAFSVHPLASLVRRMADLRITFHDESVSDARARAHLLADLQEAEPGSIHLLENVRFQPGEETNAKPLARAYASLGDLFVNDAFASCHRSHASVVGIAKLLPSYAGATLAEEVAALSRLLIKPARPFVAVLGGMKLSTKLPLVSKLLSLCDHVLVGGAMATTCLAAKKVHVGESYIEREMFAAARKITSNRKLVLPADVKVRSRGRAGVRTVRVDAIGKNDRVVDVGPATLAAWVVPIKKAKTILWNGPVGVIEDAASAGGTRFVARAVAARAKGPAFGVVGGGDTLPVVAATHTAQWFDVVSTGGGALLEYVANGGKLPGLSALQKK